MNAIKKYLILTVFIVGISLSSYAQYWTAPSGIREIPVPTLNDIAIASFDGYGPVIYYNPNITNQVGPLVTAFFHAHEYGHHNLGHVTAQIINKNNPYVQIWLNSTAENAADAYAVRYHVQRGNKGVLQATYRRFVNFPNNGDATHPPSTVRANNIANLYYQLTGASLF
ncbi:hypothetical protein [Leptobacterium sp. I13]|uniref:hypothetical protein n=1 Tax=Leptobacterium meishanense TaxID=3128904 RepID=UPI0030EC49B7